VLGGGFRLGGDFLVGRLGFGAMRLAPRPAAARENSLAVARRAVELGVTLIDTAYMYGWGANEELLAEALYPYPEELLIATKVGIAPVEGTDLRAFGPPREIKLCGRPEFLREQVEEGLRRLRMERLELVQMHRLDPEVPLADQLGALRELQEAGKVGRVGLSEINVEQLAEARQIVDIASVQNRYRKYSTSCNMNRGPLPVTQRDTRPSGRPVGFRVRRDRVTMDAEPRSRLRIRRVTKRGRLPPRDLREGISYKRTAAKKHKT
jgi:pyridoxine 4-dehydrogenase